MEGFAVTPGGSVASYVPNMQSAFNMGLSFSPGFRSGNSNSAYGYSGTYGSDAWQSGLNASSGLSQYLDTLYGIAEYNSARSAEEARNLREWQSTQNLSLIHI